MYEERFRELCRYSKIEYQMYISNFEILNYNIHAREIWEKDQEK
jgi:hypothetical protein